LVHVFLGPKHGQELIYRHLGRSEKVEYTDSAFVLDMFWTFVFDIIPDSWCFSLVNPGKIMQCDSLFLDETSVVILSRDPKAVVEQLHPALFVAISIIITWLPGATWELTYPPGPGPGVWANR